MSSRGNKNKAGSQTDLPNMNTNSDTNGNSANLQSDKKNKK